MQSAIASGTGGNTIVTYAIVERILRGASPRMILLWYPLTRAMEISNKKDILEKFFSESSWHEFCIKLRTRKSVHSFQTIFNFYQYVKL